MSIYFSHSEFLPYSETWTVYFIMGNHVYVIQALRLSALLYRIKRFLSTHFSHPECLHYSGTRTGYYIMINYVYIILWHGLSTLFRHKDLWCLLYSFTLTIFFILATNVCITMACVFAIPTTVFLFTSSGVVYVVLAQGVSPLVRPPVVALVVGLALFWLLVATY